MSTIQEKRDEIARLDDEIKVKTMRRNHLLKEIAEEECPFAVGDRFERTHNHYRRGTWEVDSVSYEWNTWALTAFKINKHGTRGRRAAKFYPHEMENATRIPAQEEVAR